MSFTLSRETAGIYMVDVNGLAGSLEVGSQTSGSEIEIVSFVVVPDYEPGTGTLKYVTIHYEVAGESTGTVEVVLSVSLDGRSLQEVTLLSSALTREQPVAGSVSYVPPSGWNPGTYAFRAELRMEDGSIVKSSERTVPVTLEAAADVVSWWTLGMIIGGMLFMTLLIVLLVLRRRQDMLRDWAEDA